MSKIGSNLLFLAVGVGAAITYIATSDNREEWLSEAERLVDRVKRKLTNCADNIEDELEELIEDGE